MEPRRSRAAGAQSSSKSLYRTCSDCKRMIILNSDGQWVLFNQALPQGWMCKETGRSHKPIDKSP